MLLCISFFPGRVLTIDGNTFRLNWDPVTLSLPSGAVLAITDVLIDIPDTRVRVRLLPPLRPETIMLGFEAPRGIIIRSQPAGNAP